MELQFEQVKLMQIFVSGRPYAQSRPRFVNGRVISSTSKGLKEWRARLRKEIRAATSELGLKKLEGAVFVDMVFLMPIKDKKRWGQVCHTKPDIDNLVKAVWDVMEGARMFARGDSQVGVSDCSKVWCKPSEEGLFLKVGYVQIKKSPQLGAEGVPEWLHGN